MESMNISNTTPIKKCKSFNSFLDPDGLAEKLELYHEEQFRRYSQSSVEVNGVYDSPCSNDSDLDVSMDETVAEERMEDSGLHDHSQIDAINVLEQKLATLTGLFMDQYEWLTAFRKEMMTSQQAALKATEEQGQRVKDVIEGALVDSLKSLTIEQCDGLGGSSPAQALLNALEMKHKMASVDEVIKKCLTDFLQSDTVRNQVVQAIVEAISKMVQMCIAEDLSTSYLMPVLKKSHSQLVNHVCRSLEYAFREVEIKASSFAHTPSRASRDLRVALERHKKLLENTEPLANNVPFIQNLQQTLENELQEWRNKVLKQVAEQVSNGYNAPVPGVLTSDLSQKLARERSVLDQFINTVKNNKLRENNVNGSFETALLALDLPLVVEACRSVDPDALFAPPCCLKQNILLSLIQQLSTDMVHDNQLKCRFLEDALMSLDVRDPVVKSNLPKVARELCHNLSSFLKKYPSHMASRRIKILIMAAGSLMNEYRN